MKSILMMNNLLKNSFIEENDFSNDISFTTIESLPKTNNSFITVNFIKNIILNNYIEKDSTIERIIEYVKKIQLEETEDKLFKLLDMRNSIKFNDDKDKLIIDNLQQINDNSLLFTLNIPFTCHTMSTLLYEIVKLNKNYPKARIMDIMHPQGRSSKVINIPK